MIEDIDRITGRLKEASIDPNAWESALNGVNCFLDSSGVVLLSVDERLRHAPSSGDLLELMDDYFSTEWHANDRRDACVPMLVMNGMVRDYDVLDAGQIENYRLDFLTRHNRKWFAGLAANLDGDLWCLALQRSVEKGPFLDADIPRMKAVQARLDETALYSRIVSQQWLDGAISALEGDGSAAIILDRAGHIVEVSAVARSIIYGSYRRSNWAHRGHANSLRLFQELLLSAIREAPTRWGLSKRALFEFNQKTYTLEATSLLAKAGLVFSKASVLVRLYPRSSDPEQMLRAKYRLTKSEIRVAMALAAGLDVETMAEAFKVSPNTIRAQLKAAYSKTETGGQAKLVAFIAQLRT